MTDPMDLNKPVLLDDHRDSKRGKPEPVLVLDPDDPMTSARAFIELNYTTSAQQRTLVHQGRCSP